jgi:hypothetical protein
MIIQKCLIALILLFSVWVIPLQLKAQSPEKWWLHSSRTDSVKKELLFHASAQYSYSKMKGVLSGVMHAGDITVVERKGSFTNFSTYGVDKMDMNLGGTMNMAYKTTSHYFTDYIDADLSKVVFGQAGFIWERDDILLLQNRYSFYTGMGINILLFKKLKLKSLVAMGRINQDYTIPVDNLDVIKKPFIAFYCKHDFVFTITPSVSFLGQVFYYTDIDAKNRYRYGSNLNLQVNVAKHINLVVGYTFKYDRELILFDASPGNSTQNIGIEVNL